jgi:hypothetical protein
VTTSSLSRQTLDELKTRQSAFLKARLVGDRAANDWKVVLEKSYGALLATPVEKVLPKAALLQLLDAATEVAFMRDGLAPGAYAIATLATAELREDQRLVGLFVPDEARGKIDKLLAHPDLIPERLVRAITEEESLQSMMRDVLFDALKQFNDTANPFFAEWGFPALIKRILPGMFAGTVLASMNGLRSEFDKSLEPEIRKFLQGFSKKSMAKVADSICAKNGDPKAIAVRRASAKWVYQQEVRTLAGNTSQVVVDEIHDIAKDIVAHAVKLPEVIAQKDALIQRFYATFGALPVGEFLKKLGITATPDFGAIAQATFPAIQAALASPEVTAWLDGLVAEFFDAQPAT